MSETKISLNEAKAKFAQLKDGQIDIAIEVTVPVTISLYKSVDPSEKEPSDISCHMQLDGDSVDCTLIDLPFDEDALAEILKINPGDSVWEVIEEPEESEENDEETMQALNDRRICANCHDIKDDTQLYKQKVCKDGDSPTIRYCNKCADKLHAKLTLTNDLKGDH